MARLAANGFIEVHQHTVVKHGDWRGLNELIAEFLEALDLREVTLVHSDWGGGLFLTAYGLDERVGSLMVLPCGTDSLRFRPALNITAAEVDEALNRLDEALATIETTGAVTG